MKYNTYENKKSFFPTHTKKISNYKKETDVFVVYTYIIAALIMAIALPYEYLSTTLYYIIVILTSLLFAGLSQNSRTPFFFNLSFYFFFFFFILYFFLFFLFFFFYFVFRFFLAIYDSSYINIFNSVSEIGWYYYFLNSTMQPGYLIFNKFVNLFTNDYLFMQLTT